MQRFRAPGLPKLCTFFRQVHYLWMIQELFKSDWLSYTRKHKVPVTSVGSTGIHAQGKTPEEKPGPVSSVITFLFCTFWEWILATLHTNLKNMFVSVQWTLQYSNEIRGTSRTVLLPSRSYHRCPCSDLRPSQPVSAQLLSEVLQHVRYFPIGSHGLPVSVASKLSGLSSFQGLYSLPYLQIKSWSPDMCHIKSLRTKEIFLIFFFASCLQPSFFAPSTTISTSLKCPFVFSAKETSVHSPLIPQTQGERKVRPVFLLTLPV